MNDYTSEIPYGYCQCGCGQKTKISQYTDKRKGSVKGEPRKYVYHHHLKRNKSEWLISFWSKVKITADDNLCWEWQAALDTSGYGLIWRNGCHEKAHRIAWMLPDYVIPNDMEICHSCDNPKCCNPKHLFLGTRQDNVDDKVKKGRQGHINGEKHGMSKLKEWQIKEIRFAFKINAMNMQQLADKYLVSHTSILSIVKRKTWKHVQDD